MSTSHVVYDNHRSISFAAAAPEIADRVITINGFSKGYVMTGWRLGRAAASRPVMKSMADVLSHITAARAALLRQPPWRRWTATRLSSSVTDARSRDAGI